MKLLITTQNLENYGAHDWDGVGECPQYWKAKGGSDYVVKNFTNFNNTTETVMALRGKCSWTMKARFVLLLKN
jgi:hypothetical protein